MKYLLFIFFFTQFSARAEFLPSSFQLGFTQVFKSSITGKDKKSEGTLSYVYPSKIHLKVNPPNEVIFVSNGVKSWYYTPPFIEGEKGELIIQDNKKQNLSKLFDAFKMGLVTNKLYSVSVVNSKTLLSFNKKAKNQYGIAKVEMTAKDKTIVAFSDVSLMHIEYDNNKIVELQFNSLDQNIKPMDSLFTFTPPANTKITEP